MVRILLTPQRLDTESNRLIQAAADMNCINSEIARIVSSLDWQVRSRGNVESLIERAASDGKSLATEVERLGQYLRTASQTFQEADASAKTRLEETTCMMPINTGTMWGVAAAGVVIPGLITGGAPIFGSRLDWIEKIIGNGHDYIITDPNLTERYIISDPVPILTKRLVDPIEQPNIDWDDTVKRKERLADFKNAAYGNNFTRGQCTWYCFGRAQEKTATTLNFKKDESGNAKDWLNTIENCKTSTNADDIRANSIAVFSGPDERYGHVVFIEEIKGDTVYFSESNWDKQIYQANPETDGIVKSMTISEFLNNKKRGKPSGYIYLK